VLPPNKQSCICQMTHLTLYTTLGCHLCEQAEAMIKSCLPGSTYELELVEIANSDELMTAYGVRIPVLRRQDIAQEIGWPFTPDDIQNLVNAT